MEFISSNDSPQGEGIFNLKKIVINLRMIINSEIFGIHLTSLR